VPNSNLTLKCQKFTVQEGLLLKGGQLGHIKLTYEECKTFAHTSPFAELPCHVSDVAAGKPELLNITASAVVLPVEFADKTFGILAEKIITFIGFLKETGCPLPLKNEVRGEACFRIVAGNDTAKPFISTNATIQEECPPRLVLEGLEPTQHAGATIKDKLLFGINTATITGKAVLFAIGAHEGKTLGVLLL